MTKPSECGKWGGIHFSTEGQLLLCTYYCHRWEHDQCKVWLISEKLVAIADLMEETGTYCLFECSRAGWDTVSRRLRRQGIPYIRITWRDRRLMTVLCERYPGNITQHQLLDKEVALALVRSLVLDNVPKRIDTAGRWRYEKDDIGTTMVAIGTTRELHDAMSNLGLSLGSFVRDEYELQQSIEAELKRIRREARSQGDPWTESD